MELQEIKGIIEHSIKKVRSVADIAQRTGMPLEDLNAEFVHGEGISAAKYVRKVRIQAMQDLLATTRLANAEIAKLVGYGTEESASRAFKNATGMTMRAYRLMAISQKG
jgi:transcriptional regulator GlxA family with amidase domain